MTTAALLFLAAIAATPGPTRLTPPPREASPPPAQTRFKCQAGGDLNAQFTSRDAKLIAIVDPGDGPHALPIKPWDGGPARIIWSDGKRTLTWNPGVQIMWMDGDQHRMCGRGEHQH